MTIAHLYPLPAQREEVVFRTVEDEDEVEAKVVRKRGRRPVKANEDAETK
jgi:hypothetical protein